MSTPIPTLRTLAAHVASTQQPTVALPEDLITYLQNYADLTTVLDEHYAIFEEFQTLGVQMASVTQWDAGIRAELVEQATTLSTRVETVLQLFNLAYEGVAQEENPEWRDYYTQLLTIAHEELLQFSQALDLVRAQLTPLPDSDDDDL